MRLFFKLAIALSLVFAFLAGITTLVLQATLMSGFQDVESEVSRENTWSVAQTIRDEEAALLALAVDYAHWDETWEFVQGRNQTYPEDQIGYATFPDLGVDAAYFFDTNGKIIWSEAPDETFDQDIEATMLPARIHPTGSSDVSELASELLWESSGMLDTSRGLLLVGAAAVLHNDNSGPAAGMVVLVKLMDAELIAHIREQARFDPEFLPLDAHETCAGEGVADPQEAAGRDVAICIVSASRLVGKTLMFGPLGQPVSVLSVSMPRDISHTGRSGLNYALVLLGVASLIAIATVGLVLQQIIIGPIGSLSATIRTVDRTGRLSTRSKLTSKDEIGVLSRNLDSMLDSLDTIQEDLGAARQVAEQANTAKSEFLAMMSHEIRTPMNGVIGMTEVLRQSDLTQKQIEMTEIIEASGRNLLEILNNILDLSKLEAGRAELHEQAGDVEEIVTSSVRMMASAAEAEGIELETEFDSDAPTSFTCDVGKLQQVLRNYIGNALKFTPGGVVSVQVSMKNTDDGQLDQVCFSVKDTGIGIDAHTIGKLFNRFVQADNSTSRKFGGTGLGLAICKELAALMGGEVGCESTVDEGSTFWIALPAREMEHGDQFATDMLAEHGSASC